MVTVGQLSSRQITLFRAVGNTVEHGNSTVQQVHWYAYCMGAHATQPVTIGEHRRWRKRAVASALSCVSYVPPIIVIHLGRDRYRTELCRDCMVRLSEFCAAR